MSNKARHVAPKTKAPAAEKPQEAGVPTASARSRKAVPTRRKIIVIAVVVVAALIILGEIAYLIFGHFYTKLDRVQRMDNDELNAAIAAYIAEEEAAPPIEEAPEDIPDDIIIATEDEVNDIQAQIQAALAANGGSKISDDDVINILLIGSDARSRTERARSDVMILVSLNKKTEHIAVTSFMRDIYTYIPNYGYNKLNAPYAIAGADYLIQTLEDDFGISIDNYAAVNFYAFADVIDAIGGVDVYLDNSEVDFINTFVSEQAAMGIGTGSAWLDYTNGDYAHLNGTQALAHCRNRRIGNGDFSRTERQREVVYAMIQKARTLSLTELYDLADTVLPLVTTDLSQGDCLSLLLDSGTYLGYFVETMQIPDVDYYLTMINGMSVIRIDFSENAAVLKELIYG